MKSGGVIHCRYAVDPARPWHGIGPLGWARESAALKANLEKRLSEEAGAPVAHVVPIPQDGGAGDDDDPLAIPERPTLRSAKGKTILDRNHGGGIGAKGWRKPRRARTGNHSALALIPRTCSGDCGAKPE